MTDAELARHVLVAVAVIVAAAQAGGWAAGRLGQPRVLGEIAAGILLGPSALGAVAPGALHAVFPAQVVGQLRPLSDLGLALFMFLVGLELDHHHLRGQGHRAVVISHVSILLPFVAGTGLGFALHGSLGGGVGRLPFALFIGAAMAVTAFPVLARILQEAGLDRTPVGALTLACAAVDDVTAWCILALVLAIASGAGVASAAITVGLAAAFTAALWFGVRPLLARWGPLGLGPAVGLALASAWATDAIGVHAIFGAFLAGIIVPRGPGQVKALVDRLEGVTAAVLLPVFFLLVGLSTELGLLSSASLWLVAVGVVAVAMVGKLGGAGLAARALGEPWRESLTIGILMNTRGLTEIVILTVGLERGLIGPTMFTIMVVMALATSLMALPLLRLVRPGEICLKGRGRAAEAVRPAVDGPPY